MARFTVTHERCRKDGICAAACPAGIIEQETDAFPFLTPGRENDCILCGHCMAFCPHQAAHIDALPDASMRPVDKKLFPAPESLEMFMRSRRSTRMFKKKPVPKDLLLRIMETARYAPSARNEQSLRWIVLHERAQLLAMGGIMAAWYEEAARSPALQAVEPHAQNMLDTWRRGIDFIFRGAPHLILAVAPRSWEWAAVDGAIALTYLELAALAHGVGACWAGYVTRVAAHWEPLRGYLGLGPEEMIAGGQLTGYVAVRPAMIPPRKPLDVEWR